MAAFSPFSPTPTVAQQPANHTSNVTLFLSQTSMKVHWSSEPIRIANFVTVMGKRADFMDINISHVNGPLPAAFASPPSIGADYSLLLPFARGRLGGDFSFVVTMSYLRSPAPANNSLMNSSTTQPASSPETIYLANHSIRIKVLPAFARMRLRVVCVALDATCTHAAQLPNIRNKTARLLNVDLSSVKAAAASDSQQRRLLTATTLLVNLEVESTNVASALQMSSTFANLNVTQLTQALGVNTSLISSQPFFFDSAAEMGANYLRLVQDEWVIPSCAACGGNFTLDNIVSQITTTDLAMGADGLPAYDVQIQYVRHRTSSAEEKYSLGVPEISIVSKARRCPI